jgi:hypothetical protein
MHPSDARTSTQWLNLIGRFFSDGITERSRPPASGDPRRWPLISGQNAALH